MLPINLEYHHAEAHRTFGTRTQRFTKNGYAKVTVTEKWCLSLGVNQIPADHRIFFEKQEKTAAKKENIGSTPRADRLLGIASHLGDISLEEIRSERLSKYLK